MLLYLILCQHEHRRALTPAPLPKRTTPKTPQLRQGQNGTRRGVSYMAQERLHRRLRACWRRYNVQCWPDSREHVYNARSLGFEPKAHDLPCFCWHMMPQLLVRLTLVHVLVCHHKAYLILPPSGGTSGVIACMTWRDQLLYTSFPCCYVFLCFTSVL